MTYNVFGGTLNLAQPTHKVQSPTSHHILEAILHKWPQPGRAMHAKRVLHRIEWLTASIQYTKMHRFEHTFFSESWALRPRREAIIQIFSCQYSSDTLPVRIGVDLTGILGGRMASAEGGRIERYGEGCPLPSHRPSIFCVLTCVCLFNPAPGCHHRQRSRAALL